jgi:branched-chain amino acid transport system permease protein
MNAGPPVASEASEPLPKAVLDKRPLLLVPVLMLLALALVGTPSTWVTLTVAGLCMGLIIFVMTSGLTLVFGLMHILNFGHGVFITVGAFAAATLLALMPGLTQSTSFLPNIAAVIAAIVGTVFLVGCAGWVFERVIVRPTGGDPLKLILTTMGGMIIGQELVKVVWGVDPVTVSPPPALTGSFVIGGAVIETYRLLAAAVGLILFAALFLVLQRTKIGLLIRAGVQNREMVESLGYRVRSLFSLVFVAGCALAGVGGVLWGMYQQTLTAEMGGGTLVLAIIVVVIGGLGSIGGCLIGSLLVGLLDNYVSFLFPKVALVSTVLLMVAVLFWRPQGLYPLGKD